MKIHGVNTRQERRAGEGSIELIKIIQEALAIKGKQANIKK